MEQLLRQRAESIWTAAIRSVLPDEAVRRALEHFHPQGRVFLVAAGKAAWQMAHAALAVLGRVDGGIVITKYGHVRGPLPGVTCCEAGHPVPDDNSFAATQRALALVSGLIGTQTTGTITAAANISHGAIYVPKNIPAVFIPPASVFSPYFAEQKPIVPPIMKHITIISINWGRAFRFALLISFLSIIFFLL